MKIIEISDQNGAIKERDWLIKAHSVYLQLRPQLPFLSDDYAARLEVVFASGARMSVLVEDEKIVAIALWRIIENTYEGRRFYIDDLVVDESLRSQGFGKIILNKMKEKAQALACDVLTLDSGTQRSDAHRFYFREGMMIPAFCFKKSLKND